jgi:hypothetical protein
LILINRSGRGETIVLFRAASLKYAIHDMTVLASETREILYQALGVQRLLNLQDVMRLLRSEVERAGSQRAFARKAGVNVSVVSKTLRGMVLPSEKILRALKLQVVYLSK